MVCFTCISDMSNDDNNYVEVSPVGNGSAKYDNNKRQFGLLL